MKKILFIGVLLFALAACDKEDSMKQEQILMFNAIPPQPITEGSVELTAVASSKLPVTFTSSDENIAKIEANKAVFKKAGTVYIRAEQKGNGSFHEALSRSRELRILNVDPNKQSQTITFILPEFSWRADQDPLELIATSSSGLPVTFTSSDEQLTPIYGNKLTLYSTNKGDYSNYRIEITASQEGNEIYNPATNVMHFLYVDLSVTGAFVADPSCHF